MAAPAWEPGPEDLVLGDRCLHLWRARISEFSTAAPQLMGLLSGEERARARHYRFLAPRERFVIGRGLLRLLLSKYTGRPAVGLRLAPNPGGKPGLAESDLEWLHFNVTHTDDLLLILLCRDHEVGVDAEVMRSLSGEMYMADLLLDESEHSRVMGLPPACRARCLLGWWTLVEALGKAAGVGLVGALSWARLALASDTGLPCTYQRISDGERWYAAQSIEPADGYVGALAVLNATDPRREPWRTSAPWSLCCYETPRAGLFGGVSNVS